MLKDLRHLNGNNRRWIQGLKRPHVGIDFCGLHWQNLVSSQRRRSGFSNFSSSNSENFGLTQGRVKLVLCQVLVVIDVVVLQQVKQGALGDVLGQTFLLDDLEWDCIKVRLKSEDGARGYDWKMSRVLPGLFDAFVNKMRMCFYTYLAPQNTLIPNVIIVTFGINVFEVLTDKKKCSTMWCPFILHCIMEPCWLIA